MKVNLNKKVKIIPKENMDGYLGMNRPAAKKIKDYKGSTPKQGTVFVSSKVAEKDVPRIARHEMAEQHLISKKKMGYKPAHKEANKLERMTKPKIRKKLKGK